MHSWKYLENLISENYLSTEPVKGSHSTLGKADLFHMVEIRVIGSYELQDPFPILLLS